MATLTVQTISRAGITPTWNNAAAGGDAFANDGKTQVIVRNNHVSASRTVTFVTQATVDGQAVSDRTVTVTAANDFGVVGPFPPEIYNDANGLLQMTHSDSAADIQLAILRLP